MEGWEEKRGDVRGEVTHGFVGGERNAGSGEPLNKRVGWWWEGR